MTGSLKVRKYSHLNAAAVIEMEDQKLQGREECAVGEGLTF